MSCLGTDDQQSAGPMAEGFHTVAFNRRYGIDPDLHIALTFSEYVNERFCCEGEQHPWVMMSH